MNSSLYTAASGLIAENRRLDLTANNLANLGTDGFRAQRAFTTEFRGHLSDAERQYTRVMPGTALAGSFDINGSGPIRMTGRGLDVALPEDRYFEVETAGGKRYSRSGALGVSDDGELTDALGHPLLDERGKPIPAQGENLRVDARGRLLAGVVGEETQELGRIRVVEDPEGVLEHEGNNLYRLPGGVRDLATVEEADLDVASLEGSNVTALHELTSMIEGQRAFESYQKLINMTMNEVNRRAINDIAG